MTKLTTGFSLILFLFLTTHAFGMEEETGRKYVLGVGRRAAERLELQEEVYQSDTDELHKRAGIKEGDVVWEFGCGTATITPKLANLIGDTGHVHAIDISKKQLDVAREVVEAQSLKNVTLYQGDISTYDFPKGTAGCVYIRFVLSHIPNPEKAVSRAWDLLKPGGIVVCTDAIKSTTGDSLKEYPFPEYRALVGPVREKTGIDPDLGLRLSELFESHGFTTESYCRQQTVRWEFFQRFMLLEIAEWKGKFVALGIITKEEIEDWEKAIQKREDPNGTATMQKNAFVIARKPM